MPRGDRTGPAGTGSMTGRNAGYCAGFGMPGYANPVPGRGIGAGFGRGRNVRGRRFESGRHGWRNMFLATGLPGYQRVGGYGSPDVYSPHFQKPDPELEKQALMRQAEALQAELDFIHQRLAGFEPEKPEI
jgi:hypothetical protein